MIEIDVKIEGIEGVQQQLQHAGSKEQLEHTMDLAAVLLEGEAKRMCPVKTGRLQKSITWRKTGELERTLYASTNYAEYVEFGTKTMPAGTPENPLVYTSSFGKYPSYRPFMRSALYANLERINQLFEKTMNEGT